jgi:hypothetical protein
VILPSGTPARGGRCPCFEGRDRASVEVGGVGALQRLHVERPLGFACPEVGDVVRAVYGAALEPADLAEMVGVGLRDRKGGKGRRVKVTTDPTQDHRDRYGRLLAYVKDLRGTFGGAQLRAGWATV